MTKKKMMTMFTYGILKYPERLEEEGAVNIVENATISGHQIYLYNSSFPITRKVEDLKNVVYGTLFDVPVKQVTNHYDYIEGYDPKRNPDENMYNREKVIVRTPDGEEVEAEMYFANPLFFHNQYTDENIIPTGNFDDRQQAKSYGSRRGYQW